MSLPRRSLDAYREAVKFADFWLARYVSEPSPQPWLH